MIGEKEIEALIKTSEDNPQLLRELKNINMYPYLAEKYYRIDDMIRDEYPELLKTYSPWAIDIHCYRLYNDHGFQLDTGNREGKATVMWLMADAHKKSLLEDMAKISEYFYNPDL